jgi:addiction module HigA family antidote
MPKMSKSPTTTEVSAGTAIQPPVHPGEILREEFLLPLGLTAYALAKQLHVPRTRIERLVAEKTPVTPDTALRLAKFFGTTPQFWMNMQTGFDLATESKIKRSEIGSIKPRERAA